MTACADPRAPNLFIIGASKCGTSALHRYLSYHPAICMSGTKEPCFFVDRAHLSEAWPIMARRPESHDLDAYLAMFEAGTNSAYRGEASVYYSQTPHRTGCAERIHRFAPDARIIYIVKDPVARTIGHFWQRSKELQEPLSLDQAIRDNPLYRDTSDYELQLSAYLEHFDRSQIEVVDARDLRDRRRDTLDDIFRWLGVEPHTLDDIQLADRHVSPPTSRVQRFPFVKTVRDSDIWATMRSHVPSNLRKALSKVGTRTIERTSVDDSAARAWLEDYFAPRIEAFERTTGQDFSHWKTAQTRADQLQPANAAGQSPSQVSA